MEELRELILAQLDELRGTGLSDARYQLYTDMVWQCDSADGLLELAAMEMQLEAHDFLVQLREQMPDDDDYMESDALALENSDGFGDSVPMHGFGADEDVVIDADVLALQKSLLGTEEPDMSDPSYFDIDALLVRGSAKPQVAPGMAQAYQDALADLLKAYPTEDDLDEPAEAPVVKANTFGSVPPTGFAEVPLVKANPSGFSSPPPTGFGAVSGFRQVPQQQGFGPVPQQTQRAVQPAEQKQGVLGVRDVFADFSKRK